MLKNIPLIQQFAGETQPYQQTISGDTIASAVWSCDPGATVTVADQGVGGYVTTAELSTPDVGSYKLQVKITTSTGIVKIGRATINVI